MTSIERIGAYDIENQVGSGGMATVYKAYQPKLDRHVAIKIMHDMFARDSNFLARFEREARIVARLDHPNIVPIYDYDDHQGRPYLVMKFVEGITLKDKLRKNTLTPRESLEIISKIAGALHYAHEQGVLHRDIKPSNILLDGRGTPYLTDFGLARIAQQGESTMSIDMILGTPHYISPEQARGETNLDSRTDVYSLGVILYELATGQVPFSGESSHAIVHSHIYDAPPLPSSINPDLTPEVEDVLLKALSKEPSQRYSNPVEMVEAYKQALQGTDINTAPPLVERPRIDTPRPAPPKQKEQPPSQERIPSPMDEFLGETWNEVKHELRQAGREVEKAFDEIREEFGGSRRDSRTARRESRTERRQNPMMWRPGATWTTDAHGNKGFFTEEELKAAEESLSPEERIRQRVEKRMEERNGLIGHVMSYVFVIAMMWFIWLSGGADGHPWPIWVMGGWGIGVASHAASFYFEHGRGRDRREDAIQREIERERERMYRSGEYGKAKNDEDVPIRLTEDGEMTDSFLDELEGNRKSKRG